MADAPAYQDGQVTLPDGRLLQYRESGDHHGAPVFYFHGTPGSRLESMPALAAKARLISVDRPGYGRSTYSPHRRLLDWPRDVAFLADRLGIERFSVVGVSGGGPHAAVCAYALPHRLTGVAIVSGMAPTARPGGLDGTSRRMRAALLLGRYFPAILHPIVERVANPQRDARAFEHGVWPNLSPSDREILGRAGIRESMAASFREAGLQGTKAIAQDVVIFARPWGFDLAAINAPVTIWQGDSDNIVPPQMAHYLARTIPRSRYIEISGGGHFMIVDLGERILAEIAG